MNNKSDRMIEDDDALGLAMRAFVEELQTKGADRESIAYVMTVAMLRELATHAERDCPLRSILRAVRDVSKLARTEHTH